ncbi:MAG: glutamate racemase, partial [Desulfobacterales bacterium]|nr:glutamate racemase [Desulfobacterales bacterium]
IDSSIAVASNVKAFLEKHQEVDDLLGKKGRCGFFVSDVTEQFEKTATSMFKRDIHLEHVKI